MHPLSAGKKSIVTCCWFEVAIGIVGMVWDALHEGASMLIKRGLPLLGRARKKISCNTDGLPR